MIKKYAIHGVSEAVFELKVGKSYIKYEFKDGNQHSKNAIPATYTTDNPIRQLVLESSDMFKNGRVFILSKFGEEKVVKDDGSVETVMIDKTNEAKPIEEVTNRAEAIEYLKELGVKATQMKSDLRIREQASIHNVSFPNWKE